MAILNNQKMTNYRWVICALLFFATTINYLDRQVLSLLVPGDHGIQAEFHWSDDTYGTIAGYFSLFYAVCMLFAGRFVDWMKTRKGFLWAIGIWSVGACLHAYCGIATAGVMTGNWFVSFARSKEILQGISATTLVASTSMGLFMFARAILALGESGNFPAAIKATAEYFPRKDRAYATSIFNSGATVGAMVAPVCIIPLGISVGWEWAFLLIGTLGFIWMGFWVFFYKKPEENPRVNQTELEYILSDKEPEQVVVKEKAPFLQCFKYKQTWSFAFGKFMTDGVWWFLLFWLPKYLEVCGLTDPKTHILPLTVLYAIVMLSLYGGKLPTIIINKTGKDPYAARMQAMLIFAFFPLFALLAQPLGQYSYWIPVVVLGIAGAAHQSWSANIFSTIGDMFPKKAIATITGIGGMAGGIGSFIIQKGAGKLFTYSSGTTMLDGKEVEMTKNLLSAGAEFVRQPLSFLGFESKSAGYFIVFCVCAVAYLIGWVVMKALVPKRQEITDL
ncbi:MAG: MFS transporter [Candidatus Azobacteroides sp.]|nr:MFS transporter [Candidatus Azobacteroides sp.]